MERQGDIWLLVSSTGEAKELTVMSWGPSRSWDIQAIIRLGWILFAILTAGFVLNYGQVYLLQYTGQRIVYRYPVSMSLHTCRA